MESVETSATSAEGQLASEVKREDATVTVEIQGSSSEKFQAVRELFQSQFDTGQDVGASLCVVHHGEVAVDLWGGTRDEAGLVPWTEDTLVNVWSTTKTMTFLVCLMLADRGELDLDAPIARYWPEFAAQGKEHITTAHVMAHTAGLSGWTETMIGDELADWDLATSRLAAQAPWWEPGTQSGYHALTQGYLLGEVVRRITETTFGAFFDSEVAKPLGADFYVGLPESEEHRVSLVIPGEPMSAHGTDHESIPYRTVTSAALEAGVPRERWWRAAEIPAANGHGNAKSVATIQQIITGRGEAFGTRLLSEKGVDRLFDVRASGVDLVLNFDLNFGLGYGLSGGMVPIGPRACFWGGFGGSLIVMDQEAELTVSYMMNKMAPELLGDLRGFALALTAGAAAVA